MGLLSRLTGAKPPEKKAADDALLVHGMMLMASADGVFEDTEITTLESFFNTLPEFQERDFDQIFTEAKKVAARYKSTQEAVKALGDIQSPAIRRKCFLLAADIAMSSGDVDDTEDQLLEAMQRVLNIDDTTAQKTLEVLSWKYAR